MDLTVFIVCQSLTNESIYDNRSAEVLPILSEQTATNLDFSIGSVISQAIMQMYSAVWDSKEMFAAGMKVC